MLAPPGHVSAAIKDVRALSHTYPNSLFLFTSNAQEISNVIKSLKTNTAQSLMLMKSFINESFAPGVFLDRLK